MEIANYCDHGQILVLVTPVPVGTARRIEERLAGFFLDDHVGNFVDALIGGETPAALQAFTTAADEVARLCFARIDDFVVGERTERALHGRCPLLSSPPA